MSFTEILTITISKDCLRIERDCLSASLRVASTKRAKKSHSIIRVDTIKVSRLVVLVISKTQNRCTHESSGIMSKHMIMIVCNNSIHLNSKNFCYSAASIYDLVLFKYQHKLHKT